MRATIKEKREVAKGTLFVLFDLLGEEVDFRAGPVLLGHPARPALRRREGAAPPHLRRDLPERARRARPVHPPARHRVQALARRAAGRRRGRRRASEGRVRPPARDRPPVRLRRRRDRDHGLPQHAPLHRRGASPAPRHARLLEPRPRVDRVPRRADRARAPAREHRTRPDDDRGRGLGRRDPDRRPRPAGATTSTATSPATATCSPGRREWSRP